MFVGLREEDKKMIGVKEVSEVIATLEVIDDTLAGDINWQNICR